MPLTVQQHNRSLAQPPLCEQLKVRDIVDDLLIQVNGSFVAGYNVSGINSYYASDEERNRTKLSLEALVRSLPERSMRLQARFEISEGTGDLIGRYNREQRNPSPVLQALDREQSDAWLKKDADGFYLRHFLRMYFIWDPRIHHQSPDLEWKKKMRGGSLSYSFEDGSLYIAIRFKDKTDFSLRFSPQIVTDGIDLSDMSSGNFKLIREYYKRRDE